MRVFLLLLGTVFILLRCTHIGPASMITYTREELVKLNHTKKPNWVNRQLIFRRRLWLPRDQRTTCQAGSPLENTTTGDFNQDDASCNLSTNRIPTVTPSTAPHLNVSTRVMSSSTLFAFLNAQSIGNKWQQINTAINEYNIDVSHYRNVAHVKARTLHYGD